MAGRQPRVVSLLPSGTEIVAALAGAGALVGRSHECDFPAEVAALPALTSAKLDATRPSLDIDRDVRRLVEEALSIYRIDAEALLALRPDVVVTQTQCEVCAVSEGDLLAAVRDLLGQSIELVALQAVGLAGIWQDVLRVAVALEAHDAGVWLVDSLRHRIDALAAQAAVLPRPRVACVEWLDPLMVAGNWVPELVALAGGQDCLGRPASHGTWIDFAALAGADPEVIVTLPCGFDIARTRAELPALTGAPGWAGLTAVRQAQVYLTDGNQYFNRPGPRVVESLEILAEILHPGEFDFGHRGRGWQPLAA